MELWTFSAATRILSLVGPFPRGRHLVSRLRVGHNEAQESSEVWGVHGYGRGDRGTWSPERSAWREEKPAKKAAARSLPFSSQSHRRGETFSVPKLEPGVSPSDVGPGCGERRGWEHARAHWRSSSRAGGGADLAGASSPLEGDCTGGPCGRHPPTLPSLSPWGPCARSLFLCGQPEHRCAVPLPLTSFII